MAIVGEDGIVKIPAYVLEVFHIKEGDNIEFFPIIDTDGKELIVEVNVHHCKICNDQQELCLIGDGNYICKTCLDLLKTM